MQKCNKPCEAACILQLVLENDVPCK